MNPVIHTPDSVLHTSTFTYTLELEDEGSLKEHKATTRVFDLWWSFQDSFYNPGGWGRWAYIPIFHMLVFYFKGDHVYILLITYLLKIYLCSWFLSICGNAELLSFLKQKEIYFKLCQYKRNSSSYRRHQVYACLCGILGVTALCKRKPIPYWEETHLPIRKMVSMVPSSWFWKTIMRCETVYLAKTTLMTAVESLCEYILLWLV